MEVPQSGSPAFEGRREWEAIIPAVAAPGTAGDLFSRVNLAGRPAARGAFALVGRKTLHEGARVRRISRISMIGNEIDEARAPPLRRSNVHFVNILFKTS
jgi:hypothetical protein